MAGRAEQPDKSHLGDSERALEECTALEADLAELKAKYEQFFLGVDRVPPTKLHDRIKRRVAELKGLFLRQTAIKFRVQSLSAKLTTYERLWERTLKEIEAGTYRRDVFKARLHLHQREKQVEAPAPAHPDEDLDLSDLDDAGPEALGAALAQASAPVPAPAPAPAVRNGSEPPRVAIPSVAPVAAPPSRPTGPPPKPMITPVLPGLTQLNAPLPALTPAGPRAPPDAPKPVAAQGGLSDQKIKAIYEAYVMAKKRCGEDTRSLTLDAVAHSLKKQVPELMRQHNARSVEFKVVIKDGKAVLRALPKDS